MWFIKPSFTNIGLNTRSTLQLPIYPASFGKAILDFGAGALAASNIPEVNVKLGSRFVWGPIPASVLQLINQYHGGNPATTKFEINLFDQSSAESTWKEIGAVDLPTLNDPVFIEVVNSATTGTPTLDAYIGLTARQVPDQKDPNSQVMRKLKYETLPSTGTTKITWNPKYNGAKIQRVHFYCTGATINSVEVKRNSTLIHDNVTAAVNSYNLVSLGKVPQSNMYHLDFVADRIGQNFLDTAGAQALEINIYLSTAAPITAAVELLDVPYNN